MKSNMKQKETYESPALEMVQAEMKSQCLATSQFDPQGWEGGESGWFI